MVFFWLQFLRQMYVLVLGLDVLGNPFGLIRGLSEGVEAFFYEPFQVNKVSFSYILSSESWWKVLMEFKLEAKLNVSAIRLLESEYTYWWRYTGYTWITAFLNYHSCIMTLPLIKWTGVFSGSCSGSGGVCWRFCDRSPQPVGSHCR